MLLLELCSCLGEYGIDVGMMGGSGEVLLWRVLGANERARVT